MENKEDLQGELQYRSPLSALRAKAYRKYVAAIFFLGVLGAAAGAMSPLAQKSLINGLNALDRERTIIGALFVFGLSGIGLGCQTGGGLLRFRLGVEARCRLKSAVFRCLLGVPESFLKERGSGYFFNRIQADSGVIIGFYSGNAFQQFLQPLRFVLAFSVLVFVHWKCALLSLPFMVCQYMLYRKYRKKQYRIGHKLQECAAVEQYRMQEYISGHTTLKTHGAVHQAAEKLDKGFLRWRLLAFQRLFLENRFRFLSLVPVYLCRGGVTVYGLSQILNGQWTLGGLWALLMLLQQSFAPVQSMAASMFQMQSVQAAWDRLRQLCLAASPAEDEQTGEVCSLKGDIVFSHVRFSYVAGQTLFQDLNLTIRKNELLFLTGANGSGKTTVFQLLLRLYDPLAGSISIAGKNIRAFPVVQYRSRIGYLGQTPEFFPGTIRENLLLDSVHSDQEILEVIRLLNSTDLISNRQNGLDAMVTERGQNFSGGERLRLALARELLRGKDILLLDEPAANLDVKAREAFYELLTGLHSHCTVIVIVHEDPGSLMDRCAASGMCRIENIRTGGGGDGYDCPVPL